MRHRAAELGDRLTYVRAETYAEAVRARDAGDVEVVHPTSYAALGLVERLGATRPAAAGLRDRARGLRALGRGARGQAAADGGLLPRARHRARRAPRRRRARRRPVELRPRQPRAAAEGRRVARACTEPWWPTEDEIDAEVRDDLDRWERDGDDRDDRPGRPATLPGDAARGAGRARPLRRAPAARLRRPRGRDPRGRPVDGAQPGQRADEPRPARPARGRRARGDGLPQRARHRSRASRASSGRSSAGATTSGTSTGTRATATAASNALRATERLPKWFAELDAGATDARCLSHTLDQVAEHGWVHHIPRLMVLGSYALQRGWAPTQVTDWFHRAFVDGYDWVMVPNVVGMSQHADGGVMATKPYTSGGAYINTMSDHCGSCRFDPKVRVGEDACPFTAGYWWFLDRHRETLRRQPPDVARRAGPRPAQGPRRARRAGGRPGQPRAVRLRAAEVPRRPRAPQAPRRAGRPRVRRGT